MYTFDPALAAEIAYRRADVRSSFRSTRRFRTRRTDAPSPTHSATGTRAHRPTPVTADVAARAV